MVSARPAPSPARRVAYPSADRYTAGDVGDAPATTTSTGTQAQMIASPRQVHSPPPHSAGLSSSFPASPPSGMHRFRSPEMSDRERSTQGLQTWWKGFNKRPPRAAPVTMTSRGVFGVPLARVLTYAAMQISTSAADGSLYVWGEVPILVGRCGAYLKSKTDIEGIFRISGSTKRMRELQYMFDDPPGYGIDIDWENSQFTPHDVATIFRRFLTQMPEPVIPVNLYARFRDVISSDLTQREMVHEYKRLIRGMPMANQYLLLYILDLLGVFAKESDKNLMTAPNLAVIFQPGVLSHPGHEMRPAHSALSKDVLEFLIENQTYFVFAMSKRMSTHRGQARSSASPDPSIQTPEQSSQHLAEPTSGTKLEKRVSRASATSQATSKSQRVLSPKPPSTRVTSPPPPKRPAPVRADTDFMLPSDSDDDAPQGGYYIVERANSPKARPLSPPMSPPPTSALQSLLPPPRKPIRERQPTVPKSGGIPMVDIIDLSDSDDDVPGGYVVYENVAPGPGKRPVAPPPMVRAHSATETPRVGGTTSTGTRLGRSNTVLHAESRPIPSAPTGATGLSRRRTLPTKRVSDFAAKMRRGTKEA